MTANEFPDVMTVEEAARFLRIGRTLAFEQAARYRATGGREGIPNIRIGRALRVPKGELLRHFGLAESSGNGHTIGGAGDDQGPRLRVTVTPRA